MQNNSHSFGIIPIAVSKIFERFAYYGMRSILILYLVHQLQLPDSDASYTYSKFLLIAGFMPLFGGLLGDLLIGTKRSTIIGGFVMAAGYFLLLIPNVAGLYTGLFLIAFGVGLFNPNSISLISNLYQKRLSKMDSAITIVYTCVSIGAFASSFLITLFSEHFGYRIGFIICGFFAIISSLILIFLNNLLKDVPDQANIHLPETPKNISIELKIFIIMFVVVALPVFWMIYEVSGTNMFYLQNRIGDSRGTSFSNLFLSLSTAANILVGIILAAIWSFLKLSSYLKLAIGLLIYAIALLFFSTFYHNEVSDSLTAFVILFIVLECISELFIAPIALSIICQYASTKFNATIIGAYLFVSSSFNYLITSLYTQIDKAEPTTVMMICSAVLVLLAGPFLAFHFITRKADVKTEEL